MGRSNSASSDDNYVPMNPGSSTLLAMERPGDNSQSVYIPMSPGPHHFDPLGYPSTALPIHRGPSRGSEIQPPPVNRNLKPDRKGKSTLSPISSLESICLEIGWILDLGVCDCTDNVNSDFRFVYRESIRNASHSPLQACTVGR